MGVKKQTPSINGYWLKTVDKINSLATITGLTESAIVGVFIYLSFQPPLDSVLFWLGLLLLAITLIIMNAILLHHTIKPLRDILAVTAKANNETTTTLKQPNLNSDKYKDSGFDIAVSAIYNRSLNTPTEIASSSNVGCDDLKEALDRIKHKIITLNHDGDIIYYNKNAPVKDSPSGDDRTELELIFNGEDNFENWYHNIKDNAVNAENTWHRISDSVPGQEERRLFDIEVNFKKGSKHETVISVLDRTKDYESDEEALDFIAFAAHELRGPITVIKGYLDVLHEELKGTLVEDQEELFNRLNVSSNKLSGYINNILNTSRYDRRHMKVILSKDSYNKVYAGIADDMQQRATTQGRTIEVTIPENISSIAVDRNSMSEVMANLIDNAIKYSNEGGLVLVSAKDSGEFVDFIVTDKGIGMPSNVVENLFRKFYRSHRSREAVAGTGIGLYITKAIVESHGGHINVTSSEGKGSTFTVSLPTYDSVSKKLDENKNNEDIIKEGGGWIKNHGMYRE